MRQSRRSSIIEALSNTAIGYLISVGANATVLPLFGWHGSLLDNMSISVIYTMISVIRGYVVRRWFNAWLHRHL